MLCLPVLLLFVIALCLFGSSLAQDESAALNISLLLGVLMCLVPPLVWWGDRVFGVAAATPVWLTLSPVYAPYLLTKNFTALTAPLVWLNLSVTLAWSLLLLLAAAWLFYRLWRRQADGRPPIGLPKSWINPLRWLVRGEPASCRAGLVANPAIWLQLKDAGSALLAWGGLAVIVVLWMIGWSLWREAWLGPLNFYLAIVIINVSLATVVSYATAGQFARARRDGAFELLLTTPLSPRELVEGHIEAAQLQFQPLIRGVLALEGVMIVGGLLLRSWTLSAVVNYLLIWSVLVLWTWSLGRRASAVRVAWIALNCGKSGFAIWGRGWRNISWNIIFQLWVGKHAWADIRGGMTFPTGSTVETVFTVFGAVMVWLISYAMRGSPETMRQRLINEFRDIVREPVPASDDPRFGEWKKPHEERFPTYLKA